MGNGFYLRTISTKRRAQQTVQLRHIRTHPAPCIASGGSKPTLFFFQHNTLCFLRVHFLQKRGQTTASHFFFFFFVSILGFGFPLSSCSLSPPRMTPPPPDEFLPSFLPLKTPIGYGEIHPPHHNYHNNNNNSYNSYNSYKKKIANNVYRLLGGRDNNARRVEACSSADGFFQFVMPDIDG